MTRGAKNRNILYYDLAYKLIPLFMFKGFQKHKLEVHPQIPYFVPNFKGFQKIIKEYFG